MFEDIFGVLQTECGYTPDEIREMTLFDVQRLTNHWRWSPPLRVLVAACAAALGVKIGASEKPDPSKYMTADQFDALVRATDGGRTIVG